MKQTQDTQRDKDTEDQAPDTTGMFPDASTAWQSFRDQAKQESRNVLIQSEKEWLSNRALTSLVTGGATEPSEERTQILRRYPEELLQPGGLSSIELSYAPSGAGTIALQFSGNNLQNPSIDGDARIEFDFSFAHLDEHDLNASIAQLQKTIEQLITHNSEDISTHSSLTDSDSVYEVFATLQSQEALVHAMGLGHCRVQDDDRLAPLMIRGIVPSSGRQILHEVSETELRHVELSNISFSGLEGRLNSCSLDSCDARGAVIAINTDTSSSIRNLSAYGALLSGDINCPLDGDFRKARLGGSKKQNRLSGRTFSTTAEGMTEEALSLLTGSVFSLSSTEDGDTTLLVNGQEQTLSSSQVSRERTSDLKELPAYKKLCEIPADQASFERFLITRIPGLSKTQSDETNPEQEYIWQIPGQPDVFASLLRRERSASTSYSLKVYQTPVLDYDESTPGTTAETRAIEFKPLLQEEIQEHVVVIGKNPLSPSTPAPGIPYSPYYARPLAAVLPASTGPASIAGPLLYMRRLMRQAMDHEYKQLLAQAQHERKKKKE